MQHNEQTARLLEAIRARRSYPLQDVLPDPIDLADVRMMLEAAIWAPTHGMTEPWRFTVVSGDARTALGEAFARAYADLTPPDKFQAAGEHAQRQRPFAAPVWISLGMYRSDAPKMPEWEDLASVAIAAQHVHLIASSMGYACKWTSGEVVRHARVLDWLGLSAPSKLLGFLYLGRPARAVPDSRRTPQAQVVRWLD
jgi:nitroreductase